MGSHFAGFGSRIRRGVCSAAAIGDSNPGRHGWGDRYVANLGRGLRTDRPTGGSLGIGIERLLWSWRGHRPNRNALAARERGNRAYHGMARPSAARSSGSRASIDACSLAASSRKRPRRVLQITAGSAHRSRSFHRRKANSRSSSKEKTVSQACCERHSSQPTPMDESL